MSTTVKDKARSKVSKHHCTTNQSRGLTENESSMEQKFHITFFPGNKKAWERKGQGAKVPGSELARILLADSLLGANWPGSEKAVNRVS